MPFPQAPAGARRILDGWRRSGRLWCCGRSCWWCRSMIKCWSMIEVWSCCRSMIKWSSPAGSCWGRRRSRERRVQSRSTPSEAKPGSLWTCGRAPRPAATPRVCHRLPDWTRRSPHSSPHPDTLWCWLLSRLRRYEVAWCGPHLKPHQRQKP